MTFLVFHFAEGQALDQMSLGFIGLKLNNPSALYGFALLLLMWTGIRYAQEVEFPNSYSSLLQAAAKDVLCGVNCSALYGWVARDLIRISTSNPNKFIHFPSEPFVDEDESKAAEQAKTALAEYELQVDSVFDASLFRWAVAARLVAVGQRSVDGELMSHQFNYTFNRLTSFVLSIATLTAALLSSPPLFANVVCTFLFGVTFGLYVVVRPLLDVLS